MADLLLVFTLGFGTSEPIAAEGAEPFVAPGRTSGMRAASGAAADAAVAGGAERSPGATSPAFGAEDSFAGWTRGPSSAWALTYGVERAPTPSAVADARVCRPFPTMGPPVTFTGLQGFFAAGSSLASSLPFRFGGVTSSPGRGGSEQNCSRIS